MEDDRSHTYTTYRDNFTPHHKYVELWNRSKTKSRSDRLSLSSDGELLSRILLYPSYIVYLIPMREAFLLFHCCLKQLNHTLLNNVWKTVVF